MRCETVSAVSCVFAEDNAGLGPYFVPPHHGNTQDTVSVAPEGTCPDQKMAFLVKTLRASMRLDSVLVRLPRVM